MLFPKCTGYSSVFKIYRFQNLPVQYAFRSGTKTHSKKAPSHGKVCYAFWSGHIRIAGHAKGSTPNGRICIAVLGHVKGSTSKRRICMVILSHPKGKWTHMHSNFRPCKRSTSNGRKCVVVLGHAKGFTSNGHEYLVVLGDAKGSTSNGRKCVVASGHAKGSTFFWQVSTY